jgi:hypothetical protein
MRELHDYLDKLEVLLEENLNEEIYLSILSTGKEPLKMIIRCGIRDYFFTHTYDPEYPVASLAHRITNEFLIRT